MKVVMINDCAHVGETILKYLPEEVESVHIKRSRGLWSKTIGVTSSILMFKGDVYHVNYLLQDCYIALRLGRKPLIGHAHGSDLRLGLRHRLWRRLVEYNLKRCDKIFVSTPDILELARQYREDAEYLPNPVDTQVFYPKPPSERDGKLKVLIASDSSWDVKGTDVAVRALSRIKEQVEVSVIRCGKDFDRTLNLARSLNLSLNVLPRVPHEDIREYYWNSDVVVDRFKLGSLGMVSLEAVACGRPVITYVSSEYPEYESFPLRDLNTEEEIAEAISNVTIDLWKREYTYLKKSHDPYKIANQMKETYEALINEGAHR